MNRKRLIVAYLIWRKLKHRRNRSTYMRPILMDNRARCELFWLHYNSTDEEELRNFCSFSRLQFDQLYNILKDGLKKSGTHAFPIKPQERLAIFLRYNNFAIYYAKTNNLQFYGNGIVV